jgi:WD40 repeat protein
MIMSISAPGLEGSSRRALVVPVPAPKAPSELPLRDIVNRRIDRHPPKNAYQSAVLQALHPELKRPLVLAPPALSPHRAVHIKYTSYDLPKPTERAYDVDWGSQFVALCIGKACYGFFVGKKDLIGIFDSEYGDLYSVKCDPTGTLVATGDSCCALALTDTETQEELITMSGVDETAVYSIDWRNPNEFTFGTEKGIYHCDTRSGRVVDKSLINGGALALSWSSNESHLAIGGIRGGVEVRDRTMCKRTVHYSHGAPVEALDWLTPSILLSGGGEGDETIKLVDVARRKICASWDIGHPVFSLAALNDRTFTIGLGGTVQEENILCFQYDLTTDFFQKKMGSEERGDILKIAKNPKSSSFCTLSSSRLVDFWKEEAPSREHKPESIFDRPRFR